MNKGPRRIAIAGASGFIGSALARHLEGLGHAVIRIGRREDPRHGNIRWDPAKGVLDAAPLAGVRIVINLCGANTGERRWSPEFKKELIDSRVIPTDLLARTMAQLDPHPRVLVNMSATGFYGDRGDEELDEDSSAGSGFLAELVRRWEAAADPAREAGIRVVHPRTAPVLHPAGGMLKKLIPYVRLGGGAIIGDGRQWVSWISMSDVMHALAWVSLHESLGGPVLVSSPNPVRNAEFMRTLASHLHRPTLVRVPEVAVRLMFGEMGQETVLSGQRIIPRQLLDSGFEFDHPTLPDALKSELRTT
ncbi:MAG TPA: TIGR01777 family oxidoreductase [Gemmatimonadaceae bacterium]